MNLFKLHNELGRRLRVETAIVAKQGDEVNVGEPFTVRFEVTNTSDPADRPVVQFTDVQLVLEGTSLADLEGGDRPVPVADTLAPGATATVEVTFIARRSLPTVIGVDLSEPYVKARVEGTLDIERFFRVGHSELFASQIRPD